MLWKIKWNEWGFRPLLCTYKLNWTKRSSWWWDDWDDTALQTQDSKFEPWRFATETLPLGHGVTNSESLRVSGEETFCPFETWRPKWGSNPRSATFQAGSIDHCTRARRLYVMEHNSHFMEVKIGSFKRLCKEFITLRVMASTMRSSRTGIRTTINDSLIT